MLAAAGRRLLELKSVSSVMMISALSVARGTRHPAAEALELDAAVRAPEGFCEQGQYGCFHAHSLGDGGHGGVRRQHQRRQGIKGQVGIYCLKLGHLVIF